MADEAAGTDQGTDGKAGSSDQQGSGKSAQDKGAGAGKKGADDKSAGKGGSVDESTAGDRGEGGDKGKPQKPDWVEDSFWDKDKGEVRTEALAKALTDTKKKLGMKAEDLTKTIKAELDQARLANRPESPDKYELKVPEGLLPAGVDWEFNDKDPLVAFARNLAHESGMGQDGFEKLVGAYIESEIAKLPDVEGETKRLGEKGKERIERVDQWLQANVSKGAYAALHKFMTKAEGIIAMEEMMQKAGAPAFVVDAGLSGDQDVLTDQVVRGWMADPKYWDASKRDPKFVEKVDKAWKKLYPGNSIAGGGTRR